jgi:hypothetical protein
MRCEAGFCETGLSIADAESKLFIDVSSKPLSRCELFIRSSQPWRLARDLRSAKCRCDTAPGPAESQSTVFANSCGNPCLIWQGFGGLHGADVLWPPKNRPRKSDERSPIQSTDRFFLFFFFFLLDLFLRSGHHFGVGVVIHQSGVAAPGNHGLQHLLRVLIRQSR